MAVQGMMPSSPSHEPLRVHCFAAVGGVVMEIDPANAARMVRAAPTELREPTQDPLVWIDVLDPGLDEADYLRDELGMHPLSVEDCLRGRQRPKVERYPGYFFLVFYATRINPQRERMALNELHLFLGTTFIITVHDQRLPEVQEVIVEWRHRPQSYRDSGAAAHALLDRVTDNYFPVMEHFSNRLEALEDHILTGSPSGSSMKHAIHLRQEMILLRRVLAPQRDVLSSLVRRDLPFLRPELVPYFADVEDHILRATEEIDSFRDLVTGLIEVNSSNASNQLNRTMQVLTSWSIILMSMGIIAGIYGMNFVLMPELELAWGYPGALAAMIGIGLVLLLVFRRKEWL